MSIPTRPARPPPRPAPRDRSARGPRRRPRDADRRPRRAHGGAARGAQTVAPRALPCPSWTLSMVRACFGESPSGHPPPPAAAEDEDHPHSWWCAAPSALFENSGDVAEGVWCPYPPSPFAVRRSPSPPTPLFGVSLRSWMRASASRRWRGGGGAAGRRTAADGARSRERASQEGDRPSETPPGGGHAAVLAGDGRAPERGGRRHGIGVP